MVAADAPHDPGGPLRLQGSGLNTESLELYLCMHDQYMPELVCVCARVCVCVLKPDPNPTYTTHCVQTRPLAEAVGNIAQPQPKPRALSSNLVSKIWTRKVVASNQLETLARGSLSRLGNQSPRLRAWITSKFLLAYTQSETRLGAAGREAEGWTLATHPALCASAGALTQRKEPLAGTETPTLTPQHLRPEPPKHSTTPELLDSSCTRCCCRKRLSSRWLVPDPRRAARAESKELLLLPKFGNASAGLGFQHLGLQGQVTVQVLKS